MVCTKCGHENEDGSKFCLQCGAPLEAPAAPAAPQNYCPQCGSANDANVRFCQNCGCDMTAAPAPAPVEAPVAEEAPAAPEAPAHVAEPKEKKGGLKKVIIGVAAVVVVALIALVCVKLIGGGAGGAGNYLAIKSEMFTYQGEDEFYIGDAKSKIVTIDTESTRGYDVSMYGDKAVVLTKDDVLYYYSNGKVEKVSEDVYSYRFCADGSAVAFTTEGDDYYDLHVYTGGKVKDIAKEVDGYTYCISPDGSAVGYIGDMDDKDDDFKGYVWNGSKSQELGKNKAAIALSDGGKYVYYFKGNDDNTIFVQKSTNEDTKIKLTDNLDSLYLNADGTEALVIDRDGKTSVSAKAGEKVKLSSSKLYPLLPTYSGCSVWQRGFTVYGVKSFANILFREYGSDKIVSSNSKYETETVVKNAESAQLAEDGKTLYFMKGDSIRMINASKKNADAVTLVDEDVRYFVVCADSKSVLFLNDDREVFLQKGTGKPKMITDDYDDIDMYKGSVVFYITDEELFSTTGGKATKITGLTGDVTEVYGGMFGVQVSTNDDGDYYVYYSNNGKSFTEIVRE